MITTSLVVSCLIFFLIAMREWLPSAVRIWHIMVAGAVVLLLLGEISPQAAFKAIDWNVIAYLFGVFAIAAALYDSGHLARHRRSHRRLAEPQRGPCGADHLRRAVRSGV